MAIQINKDAVSHANGLIRRGAIVHDDRDDWSEHAPSASDGNAYIDEHGMKEYAKWFLGEDSDQPEENKGRYLFPYGDFTKVHRCAVISGEGRAGQYNHGSIEKAEKDLLEKIDKKQK
jgi:hypothetical protein